MSKTSHAVRGVIRYDTQHSIEGHWSAAQMRKRVLLPRVLVYAGVLLLIVVGFGTSLALRAPFRADVVRERGALARLVEDGRVENVYGIHLMNATESAQQFRIEVDGLPDAVVAGAAPSRSPQHRRAGFRCRCRSRRRPRRP